MRKYDIVVSFRLSRADKARYDRLIGHYHAGSLSRSESFRLLLEKINQALDQQLEREYWANVEIEPPESS